MERFNYTWNIAMEVLIGAGLGTLITVVQILEDAGSADDIETWFLSGVATVGRAALVSLGLAIKHAITRG